MKASRWSGLTDEALVRVAVEDPGAERSREAAGELLGRYRRRVYAWCWQRVGQHDLALDLAQDALFQAWRALGSWTGEGPFAGWLFVIVRNRCHTAMRRRSLVRDDEIELETLESRAPDVLEEVAARMETERVLALVTEHLDPLEQQALWMRAMEGLSVPEITEALGLEGRSGARGLLQTARRKLRAALLDSSGERKE